MAASSLDDMLAELEANFDVQDHETLDTLCSADQAEPGPERTSPSNRPQREPAKSAHDPSSSLELADAIASVPVTDPWLDAAAGSSDPPAWGQHFLVSLSGPTATAKFAGGGSDDMPTVLAAARVDKGGRAKWEVRFDKKGNGTAKVGLVRVDASGGGGGGGGGGGDRHGDGGVKLGQNWSDRRCVGLAWYLDSEGSCYDGNRSYADGTVGYSSGDVVSVEVNGGEATFHVNGQTSIKGVPIRAWPIAFAVLLVFKGDKVTLLSERAMDGNTYAAWSKAQATRTNLNGLPPGVKRPAAAPRPLQLDTAGGGGGGGDSAPPRPA